MADVKINKKTYEGVLEVQIPLADGSGNASFKDLSIDLFNNLFNYVGTYAVEDDGTYKQIIGDSLGLDIYNKIQELQPSSSPKTVLLVVPKVFDDSQADIIAGIVSVKITSEGVISRDGGLTVSPILMYYSPYYKRTFITTTNISSSDAAFTGGIPLVKSSETQVITATGVEVYVITNPPQ